MFASTAAIDLAQAQDGMTVRFWSALAAAKYDRRSIARDGSMTLTSGMLAHRPLKGAPIATAVGGAVEHLTPRPRGRSRSGAGQRRLSGVILTDQVRMMPEETLRSLVAPLPVPRSGSSAEAARAYVYLTLNGYATGQILPVDGGGLLV